MTQTTYKFVGIGNPLLDISSVVEPSLLTKYALKANDAILAEAKHSPLYEELIKDYKPIFIAGGAAQNTMRGAQWLLPAQSTLFIGCVGKDETASVLKSAAEKDGLRTAYLVDQEKPTGRCAVLITDVHRCLVTDLQAANEYKIDHLKQPDIWSIISNAEFFYSSGYFLTVSPQSALLLAEHACEHNKHFAMNLSAPFIPQFFKEPLDTLAAYWDILFGNESEAEAYAQSHNLGTSNVSEIALKIAALPKKNTKRSRIVVITQGVEATIVAVDGKVTLFPIVPIPKEKIVDTNGAGDAFAGGFMAQYVQGKSIETCVACGHYVASIVVQRDGPSYPSEAHQFKC